MIRTTVLALLLGGAALAVLLTLFFRPSNASVQQAPPLVWNASAADVVFGSPTVIDSVMQLELDGTGAGLVNLPTGNIDAQDFSFIHLALETPAHHRVVTIVWANTQNPEEPHAYTLESQSQESLWLSTAELRGWSGEIDTLGLRFSGGAGDTVYIRDFSAFPASAVRQLQAIHSDLTSYAPWNSAAMNTYTGAFNAASFYPTMLAVALLALSLLAYGLLLVIFRKNLRFNLAVVALIFFGSWIILDMYWQNRLLHQLVDTHRQFAGKSTEERLAVGPDAKLYTFVTQVKLLLESTKSRIFVTSNDAYSGMRAAYYFYPLNVYWSLYGPALPHKKALRSGDYIALIQPSLFTFDAERSRVTTPKRQQLKAELVFSDPSGTVVRLK
tara:strand:- start:11586 stop:12740 length:1155 start_codon:yes stop_codon:yes gene_type:complete